MPVVQPRVWLEYYTILITKLCSAEVSADPCPAAPPPSHPRTWKYSCARMASNLACTILEHARARHSLRMHLENLAYGLVSLDAISSQAQQALCAGQREESQ